MWSRVCLTQPLILIQIKEAQPLLHAFLAFQTFLSIVVCPSLEALSRISTLSGIVRLINTHTLELKEFLESDLPKYAILSYTWETEEVMLQ